PGAVGMIVDKDGVTFARTLGEADAVGHVPMREDTLFQIASMTKAITSVAAMQLVEAGRLSLDADIGAVLPDLANPQVMVGTGAGGKPELRPAKGPITLRHLLTHTAGLGYFFIHPEVLGYYAATGMPEPGSLASIKMPLMFDPGESWEYSVATDWVGQAIEAVTGQTLGDYLAAHVTGPLGMTSTAFRAEMPANSAKVHVRAADGSGWEINPAVLGGGEFHMGGGGLSSTAADYARFVRMLLRGGELDGVRILKPETIAEMTRNQVGPLRAGKMGSAMPELAGPYDTFPDQHTGWGLGFLINPEKGPHGRSPGSLAWAGIFNSYYWFDPAKGVGGVFMSQIAPFGDPGALAAFGALEELAYR
ncbi:MAG: serine hydrolase, partial [Pseudomonadota bacterium]|nr:serine hydrolase [Pseudomonadota bacterium]